jgi:DNA helicase HerA-like ATPase
MGEAAPIGFVLGTKPASSLVFYVLVDQHNYLEMDDVVFVRSGVEGYVGVEAVTFYGTVIDVQQYHEGITFASDTTIVRQGIMPAGVAYVGTVQVTKLEPEVFVAPHPGDDVFRATGAELDKALSFDVMKQRIPVGVMRNKEPFYVNFEFLNGAKGAHVSISGVSGVATKTSFALFLLYSMLHFEGTRQGDKQLQDGMPKEDKAAAHAIVFNVKGEDMLFLDMPNRNLTDDHRAVYTKMGLPTTPFTDVRFFASPKPGTEIPSPSTEQRHEGVTPYVWTMRQFAQDRLLPFLFAEGDQETTNLYGLIQHLTNRLEYLASDRNMENDAHSGTLVFRGQTIGDLKNLITVLETDIMGPAEPEEGKKAKKSPAGSGGWFTSFDNQGTQLAFLRRLRVAAEAMQGIVRSDVDHPDKYRFEYNQHRVTVVDISKLKPVAQKFIVGSTLKMLMTQKEAQGRKPYVFVVLDELNKYAPREGHSPIQDILLDIAERGRSLGVILIGAQQSASRVEKRITGNCSIRVNGRLDFAESQSPEYDYLPESFRLRSTIIKPGTMIVHQPDIPAPVLINFPLPAWATRSEEVEDKDLDKQAQEFAGKF